MHIVLSINRKPNRKVIQKTSRLKNQTTRSERKVPERRS